jgi:hypothetical protein
VKTHLIIALFLLLAGSALGDTFRVTYTYRGLGKRITVSAESSQDARNTVKDLFLGSYVTGCSPVGGRK